MPPYIVLVDNNSHYMDGSDRYVLGTFETPEEAVVACTELIDRCLREAYFPGIESGDLWNTYAAYGDDPFIVGHSFSAWDYARMRCEEMCRVDH